MLKDLRSRLRPMGFSDILDEAVDLYRRNFLLLFGIGALLYVPLSLMQTCFGLDEAATFNQNEVNAAAATGRLAALALILGIETVLITGAMTFATAQIYLERPTGIWECYRKMLRPATLLSFIWANVLFVLFVAFSLAVPGIALVGAVVLLAADYRLAGTVLFMVGLAACAVPAYVGARLAVYTPAFFVEGRGAWKALARSWELIKGRVAITFGIVFVVSVVIAVVQGIALAPFAVIMARDQLSGTQAPAAVVALNSLLRSGLSALLAPINALVVILIYYDARIRKEGFDLEMLADDLDRKSRQAAPWDRLPPPEEKLPEPSPGPQTPQEPNQQ